MFTGLPNQVVMVHKLLGDLNLYCEGQPELLFTENETNTKRLYDHDDGQQFYKDGINNYLVRGQKKAVNPEQQGTKASVHYTLTVEPGQSRTVRLRLSNAAPQTSSSAKAIMPRPARGPT